MAIFLHGSLLQEDVAIATLHKNVHGPVKESIGVDNAPRGLANHPILRINYVKDLVRIIGHSWIRKETAASRDRLP